MGNDWRQPYDVPDSLQRLFEDQQRQVDRVRDLFDTSRITGTFERMIADQQRQADRLRDLVGSSTLISSSAKLSATDNSATAQIKKLIEGGIHAPTSYEKMLESISGIAPAGTRAATYRRSQLPEERVMNESPELQRKLRDLEKQLTQLHADVSEKTRALKEQEAGSAEKDDAIRALQQTITELSEAQRLAHLLARVEPGAQRQLLESPDFRKEFDRDEPCDAYVMSIDIRRSTELMLKARDPKLFAQFLLGLTRILREIVLSNHGVFDKFTGDGVLAFFPTFYSGSDAGLLVLQAAAQAHAAFQAHYDSHRHCFLTVRRDVGLGIGVDFGRVQIVQIESEFTVVGTPVVYACRMAGADAGQTLVNQPGFEQLSTTHSIVCDFTPLNLEIKHEGPTLAYAARLNGRPYMIEPPSWYSTDSQTSA
jgi:class 3 adenylate cyclase